MGTTAPDEFADFSDAPAASASSDEFAGFADAPPDETAGRLAGLGGRALLSGAADLAAFVPNMAGETWENIKQNITGPSASMKAAQEAAGIKPAAPPSAPASNEPYAPKLEDFVHPSKWREAAQYFADKAGAPKPATPAERIGSAAVEGVPSAIMAPEAPIAGAISGALSGGASQSVAEAGGGRGAQLAAGLLAGGLPAVGAGAAAATRGLARGGADGQAAMQARIADAAASGTQLTTGQATGSRLLQKLESASGSFWGGGSIEHARDAQTGSLGSHVDRIVDNLTNGADASPTGAGTAINTGVNATKQSMRQQESAAYDAVDKLVPGSTGIDISGTLGKLDALAAPTPGAEATSAALVSPKIKSLRDNLAADVKANGGSALPYSTVRQLRSVVGGAIDHGFAPANPSENGALKQIYGALTDDLNAGASAVGPKAAQAVQSASALYKANQATRELLDGIVDKAGGPEAVYQAATSGTKQGATKIAGVLSALDPNSQNVVRGTIIDRMGRALPGQQTAAGDAFDASRFLTNWNTLSAEAKDAIFGASGSSSQLRSGLDSLTRTLETLRTSGALKNPSGTGAMVGHGLGLSGLFEAGGHLLTGHVGPAIGVGSAIAGNAVLSRALTNPRVVNWLASSTKMPTAALPGAVSALARMGEAKNDPDAQDLAAYLRSQGIGR